MSSTIQKDVETVARWRREGKSIVPHTTPAPPYAFPPAQHARIAALAEREANELKLSGPVRLMFLIERTEGWIAAGQLENVTQQGLLDELITPLTGGLVHGPGPSTTKVNRNPQTGNLQSENVEGATEKAGNALSDVGGAVFAAIAKIISTYGVRLLEIVAGGVLVLFGLATLAKGAPPKMPAVVPV